jgi:hypothetical protein
MEKIKQNLRKEVKSTKETDLKENIPFWNDVLLEIENATTEEELFRIGQEYFSFTSIDQIKNL